MAGSGAATVSGTWSSLKAGPAASLPPLTVSRIRRGSRHASSLGDLRHAGTAARAIASSSPAASPRPGGSPRAAKVAISAMGAPKVKRKIPAKPLVPIEETLCRRRGLREMSMSMSEPALLGDIPPSVDTTKKSKLEPAEVPRTYTPSNLRVPRTEDVFTNNNWHALLCGRQQIDMPDAVATGNPNACLAWYRQREIEQRELLRPRDSAALSAGSSEVSTSYNSSQMSTSAGIADTATLSQLSVGGSSGSAAPALASARRLPDPVPASAPPGRTSASLWRRPLPADLVPKITERGWTQVKETSIWAQQARQLASWRVNAQTELSPIRERALHERMKLLSILEQYRVPQGLEALQLALCFRCGSVKDSFKYLDVGDTGSGPTLAELAGSLALLGLDVPSLCGFDSREAHKRLDLDCDGRVSLQDLLGEHTIQQSSKPVDGLKADSWSTERDAADPADDGSQAAVRFAIMAKFVALSAWFRTPNHVRRRGRAHADSTDGGEEPLLPPPDIMNPPWGAVAVNMLEGEFSTWVFQKLDVGSEIPEGWHLATHQEVASHKSDVDFLLGEWDICGLAGGWRIDGRGYGSNLKEPHGSVEFGACVICKQEQHSLREAPRFSAPTTPTAGSGDSGPLARQQALDALRLCWSPNEGDLEAVSLLLKAEFEKNATSRQFGEQLLSRSDLFRLLGELPRISTVAGNDLQPFGLVEVGEIYDSVLESQVSLTSLEGRILSKGRCMW